MTIFLLLVIFQLKHFICDYPLQTPYMLGKFKDKGWVLPLASHCLVHVLATFNITLVFTQNFILALLLGVFDFIVHFTMDRIKASPKMLGRFNTTQPYFWWSLGLDQMVHHLTHYVIIAFIVYELM